MLAEKGVCYAHDIRVLSPNKFDTPSLIVVIEYHVFLNIIVILHIQDIYLILGEDDGLVLKVAIPM